MTTNTHYPPQALAYTSTAGEKTKVVKATPGRLLAVYATNTHASTALYVQIHNRTAAPTAGQVPAFPPIKLAAGASMWLDEELDLSTGITLASSTTAATWTDPTSSDLMFHVRYQ